MKKLSFSLAALMISSSAVAQTMGYAGNYRDSSFTGYYWLGYTHAHYREAGTKESPGVKPQNMSMFGMRAGSDLNAFFGVELRAGMGVKGDITQTVDGQVENWMPFYVGAYARPKIEFGRFAPYLLLGYNYTQLGVYTTEARTGRTSVLTHNISDGVYGAGLDFTIGNNFSLNMEYSRLMGITGHNLSYINVGFSATY